MKSELTLGARPGTPAELPVLDATVIDHAIRHGAIFGALDASPQGIQLIAPHDPQRLLAQLDERWPGEFQVTYLERDTAWRLSIARRGAVAGQHDPTAT